MDVATNDPEWFLRFLDDLDFAAGVVHRDGTFLFVNRVLRQALEDRGQSAPGPAFLRAIEAVSAGGGPFCGVVDVGLGGAPWNLRLWAFDGERVAFYGREVWSTERPATRIADKLGLELTEARLALHVAQGRSNTAIARLLGVKVGTLKTRLWKVFRRVRVRNRTELANRILQCLAPDAPELSIALFRLPALRRRRRDRWMIDGRG